MSKKKKNDILTTPHFLIDNIVYKKLESRSQGFYTKKYKQYTTISLVFSILTFLFSSFGHYVIVSKNQHQKTYLSNILGQTEEYVQTEDRIKTINEAKRYYIKNQVLKSKGTN